jgi:predicted GH43/DUF377 family glycosyl hydrolase
MNWIKQNKIFSPNGELDWMYNYAAQVCSFEFDVFIRIYFTTRSKLNDGNYETKITFLDCDKTNPSKIYYIHNKPLLSLGQPGTFDEHGTMMSDIVFFNKKYYLYYLGWQRNSTVPYITTLGLATSDDGVSFKKVSEGPIIGLNRFSPFGIAKTSILIENNVFKMWYTHYNSWHQNLILNEFHAGEIEYRPTYDIRYAESKNGLDWDFKEEVCISPTHDNEALGAPCVRKINNEYHMWYGYRDNFNKGEKYKMGYAISKNGIVWNRTNINPISTSEHGWDSEMVCYPNILLSENTYMFYSGNGYGKEGFGYAKLN